MEKMSNLRELCKKAIWAPDDVRAVVAALPLLLAVAEAAKENRKWFKEAYATCDDHPKPSTCTACVLDTALAALAGKVEG